MKLLFLQARKIRIQFKRLSLNYRRYKLEYDPWRREEDIYKYAEDEKEFNYWRIHGMSRLEANELQLQQEKYVVDRFTEKHPAKVQNVYKTWLKWLENEDNRYSSES